MCHDIQNIACLGYTRWGIITRPPSFKRHNLVNYTVYLHESFRQYSRGNAESANLKMIRLLLNVLCQQQFKETSVEVLHDRYSPTPYHYITPTVGHLPPFKCPRHLPPVKPPLLATYLIGYAPH